MPSNADRVVPEQESVQEEPQESSPVNPDLTHVPGHSSEDPVPPSEGPSDETWIEYSERLLEYASVWCSAYRHILQQTREIVWGDFTRNAATLEKQLQIDVAALRESHNFGEMHRVGWIPGSANPARLLGNGPGKGAPADVTDEE